jgi:hypothetical protein
MFIRDPDTSRDADEGASLRCPSCAGALTPLSGRGGLVFLCDKGHEVAGEELVAEHSFSVLSNLEEMLHAWELRLRNLESTAAEAGRRGHIEVVEIFQRQMDVARARVDSLREALGKVSVPATAGSARSRP